MNNLHRHNTTEFYNWNLVLTWLYKPLCQDIYSLGNCTIVFWQKLHSHVSCASIDKVTGENKFMTISL